MEDTDDIVASQGNAHEVIPVDVDKQQQQPNEAQTDEEGKKRKAIVPRSDVWQHFSKVKTEGGEERSKCKHCSKLFRCDTKTNGLVHWCCLLLSCFSQLPACLVFDWLLLPAWCNGACWLLLACCCVLGA